MNARARYTAFDPEIFLTHRLRQHEQAHFAATHGMKDQLVTHADGSTPTTEEIQGLIDDVRRLLHDKPWRYEPQS